MPIAFVQTRKQKDHGPRVQSRKVLLSHVARQPDGFVQAQSLDRLEHLFATRPWGPRKNDPDSPRVLLPDPGKGLQRTAEVLLALDTTHVQEIGRADPVTQHGRLYFFLFFLSDRDLDTQRHHIDPLLRNRIEPQDVRLGVCRVCDDAIRPRHDRLVAPDLLLRMPGARVLVAVLGNVMDRDDVLHPSGIIHAGIEPVEEIDLPREEKVQGLLDDLCVGSCSGSRDRNGVCLSIGTIDNRACIDSLCRVLQSHG